MKENFSIFKEFFSMIKEAIIVLLFLILILWPSYFQKKLVDMGINKVEIMGMNMDLIKEKEKMEKTADASTSVANMQIEMNNLKGAIDSIAGTARNPEEKKTLNTLASKTVKIVNAAKKIDNNLKNQMSMQQDVLTQMKIVAPKEGWICVGKLNEDKKEWDSSVNNSIQEHKTNYAEGEILTILDDVYLRSNGSPLVNPDSKVTGIIKGGEQVKYLAKDYAHSVGGGWFLWLKVSKNS